MVDNDYTLEGRFEIANENMKQEMNELIIQILYKTGIRKTTTVMINGREFDAVEQTYPDENGIIYFDYSVFEKRIRRGNYYNCHTCELVTEDRGENEFGLVMNMIMIILESYSDSPCYLMHKGNLFNILGYVDLVESLTGKVLTFKNRDNICFYVREWMYERAGASVKRACADVRAAGHALEADRGEMSR